MENFLSKPIQKELLAKVRTAYEDVWQGRNRRTGETQIDQHMVDFCVKDIAVVVPLHDGLLTVISKPRIETDFCFGYSSCGQGPTHKEMSEEMDGARSNLAEYFIEQNLDQFDRHYAELMVDIDFNPIVLNGKYHSQSRSNPLRSMTTDHVADPEPTTAEDRENFRAAVKFVREGFVKRLNTYVKRYGTKTLRTWSYWIDA